VHVIRRAPARPGRAAVPDPAFHGKGYGATVARKTHAVTAPAELPLPPARDHDPGFSSTPRKSVGALENRLALFSREDSIWIRCRSRNRPKAARFPLPAHAFLRTSMTVNCSNTAGGAVTL